MKYWLIKSEPNVWSIDQQKKAGAKGVAWDGVRNYQAANNLKTDQVLIASTSETYGNAQYTPIDENHPLVGQSPYSATKIAADQLALSYYRSFELPIKIVRPFNTFGPRQSSRAVIPTIVA